MKNLFTILIWVLISGNNLQVHLLHVIHHLPSNSQIENKFEGLVLVLILSVLNEFWQVWVAYKKYHQTFLEEVLDVAIIIFTAATFAELLSLSQVYFGFTCLSSFLANIIIKKFFNN